MVCVVWTVHCAQGKESQCLKKHVYRCCMLCVVWLWTAVLKAEKSGTSVQMLHAVCGMAVFMLR